MREVYRSAIVPYPAEAVFDLVADIAAYSEFLPWCNESKVLSAKDTPEGQEVVASLGLLQGALSGAFTTRNQQRRPTGVTMSLVEGPFSELEGEWKILPLGEQGCKLELQVSFAFSNPMKDMILGAVFEQTCNKLVDAFVRRAGEVYGSD
ncbi:MAG: type II toxin-antitoxin system RatA family toxin [Gammaproteobacteria bacterium]|nr:type II toxin-antitoxin system RatA family toxin [Gammaproteobacteria bacterium]